LEHKLGENQDVRADQAALDEAELQELEGQLYGQGAGPAQAVEPAEADEPADPDEHGHHLPHLHRPKRF
jgi:hypothetical protein